MNDTSPETEAFLNARFAAMTGSERALMALQMFETAQRIVLSSLDPSLSEAARIVPPFLRRRAGGCGVSGSITRRAAQAAIGDKNGPNPSP